MLSQKCKLAKDAADRWTDGVWATKSYLVKKYGQDPKSVSAMLRMGDTFDYVE